MGKDNFLPIVAAAFVILVASGFILFKSSLKNMITLVPKLTPSTTFNNGATDSCDILTNGNEYFPGLYENGVNWENSKITEYEVPSIPEANMIKGCLINSQELSMEISSNLESFYIKESNDKRWIIENAGDAPGSSFVLWRINNRLFLLRISSVPGNINLKVLTLFLSE